MQVETFTDMSLLQSSHMAPYKSHNKIIQGTSQPHHIHKTLPSIGNTKVKSKCLDKI